MGVLQEILGEFKCNVLNYTNDKILVYHFYSEERYNDFLNGSDCRAGVGLFNTDEGVAVAFNKLNDNTLIIVQKYGIETARYKYVPIFKATMEYKYINDANKKFNKTLTFRIRKNEHDNTFNYIDTEDNSLDFNSVNAIKNYLDESYESNKLTDWSVFVG